MRIRKRDSVTAFAVLFGGIGTCCGCLVSPTMGTSGVPQPGLGLLITVLGCALIGALFGAGVGLLFARHGDPPEEPPP